MVGKRFTALLRTSRYFSYSKIVSVLSLFSLERPQSTVIKKIVFGFLTVIEQWVTLVELPTQSGA